MIKWFLIGGLVGIFLKEFFKQLQNEICFWRDINAEMIEELLQIEDAYAYDEDDWYDKMERSE